MTTRQTGTVARWLNHKGIGFITPSGQNSEVGKDIIVHFSEIKQEGEFKSLVEGSTVEYDIKQDPKNADKQMAVNVTGVGGGECEKRVRAKSLFEKGDGSANDGSQLFVSNLHYDTNWRQLKDLMRECGNVDRVDVKRGLGIVKFSNKEDAAKAIEKYNGYELQGRKIEVKVDEKSG